MIQKKLSFTGHKQTKKRKGENTMKKITKAQKALYPEFVIYIDTTAKGEEVTGHKVFTKAMEEKNILDAMKRAEQCIKKQGENIYLVDIYAKTDKENEQGEPLYKTVLMTRVHMEYGQAQSSNWHFRDSEHNESEDGYYEWLPNGLDFTQRNGILSWHSK